MKIIEIPLTISYDKMEDEEVVFGLTLDEDETENYDNDVNIFYYMNLEEFNNLCNGIQMSDTWEVKI